MTAGVFLEWGLFSVSLSLTLLLLWLGLTVLLNAARRRWGVWVTGGAMVSGALFFLYHTALVSLGVDRMSPLIMGRWPLAWAVGGALPCAWYLVMLWHAGFWEHPTVLARARWHHAFLLSLIVLVGIGVILFIAMPFSLLKPLAPSVLLAGPMCGGIPVVAIVYTAVITLSIAMSLDVVWQSLPSHRMMGTQAHDRARPWLVAASLLLFAVTLLVGWAVMWIAPKIHPAVPVTLYAQLDGTIPWLDLLTSGMVLLAVICLGQAIVSYEIFTGQALPRRGLRRNWLRTLVLTAGISLLLGGCVALAIPPLFSALALAMLTVAFFALYCWRAFADHERYMAGLRSFAGGPRLYADVFGAEMTSPGALPTLTTLCEDVLGVRVAYLLPSGPFASLIAPSAYPASTAIPEISTTGLFGQCLTDTRRCIPLDPARYGGTAWAVPLWSARGLIGCLLLGEKRDNGLFSQEEMETARMVGERLLDTLAGAEFGRRLLHLQRTRMAESQTDDRRLRRVLHDDILPQLHLAMLSLSAHADAAGAVGELAEVHRHIADLLRDMPSATQTEALRHGVFAALRHAVETECAQAFAMVTWEIAKSAERAAALLNTVTAEVVFAAAREAIRNAARYGRHDDNSPLHLTIRATCSAMLRVEIIDDGVGIGMASPSIGSGQGIMLHSTMMTIVGGSWECESRAGEGTRIMLSLPCTMDESLSQV